MSQVCACRCARGWVGGRNQHLAFLPSRWHEVWRPGQAGGENRVEALTASEAERWERAREDGDQQESRGRDGAGRAAFNQQITAGV